MTYYPKLTRGKAIATALYVSEAALANYLAFFIRFEGAIPADHISLFLRFLPLILAIRILFYIASGLHRELWRYTSVSCLLKIILSATLGTLAFIAIIRYGMGDLAYPRSVYVLDWMLLIMLAGGARLAARSAKLYRKSPNSGTRILVIGAGDAGELVVRDMNNNPNFSYSPVGFLDDDPRKKSMRIHGVPILGGIARLPEVLPEIQPEELLIAIPSASRAELNRIYDICKPYGLPIKTLPSIGDIVSGKVLVSQIRALSLEDLLQREPVKNEDMAAIRQFIKDKAVLVTGAGGSIGSELCRQIISHEPSRLIMLDRYENGIFEVDRDLKYKYPDRPIATAIGDILDAGRLRDIFAMYRPHVVFHAAAHKHVPLMEENPLEAVKNNIFGTRNVIQAAADHGAENFVMISTDKAVNPVNVMGATKRVAELLVLDADSRSETKFTTVRFGNVLGSNGSVIHTFRKQIKESGILTVTHPEIKRFFMLISEAVYLVLKAASAGKGGEIFVLDMGEPIKIVDLANNIIRLSGCVSGKDVSIQFTSLRPGEKLYEELFDDTEIEVETSFKKIRTAISRQEPAVDLDAQLVSLKEAVLASNTGDIYALLKQIVPTYSPFDDYVRALVTQPVKPQMPSNFGPSDFR
ncbi:MAG: nucleoside-diphosphate sugar epimerase/dehydratase [Thermodesulfovibrionales bacterium]